MTSTELSDPPPTEEASPAPLGPQVSRRGVLRTTVLSAATLAVAGTGALSYRVYDNAVLTPGSGSAFDPWREWRDTPGPLGAVACAVLAASPHNTQPWTFVVAGDVVELHVDPARITGSVDPLRREQYVGLGCALENLVLGARARGLTAAVSLLPDGESATVVARVGLTRGATTRGPLHDAIGSRHTNRGPYDTARPVAAATLTGLVDPTGLDGVAVQWLADDSSRRALSDLLVDAAEALVADDGQSRDNFAWFRASHDDIERHRDGLGLDGQGLSPLVLGLAKVLPASSRTDGDRFWVTRTRDVHTATAAAYGVITSRTPDDRRTQLLAGRLLQRVHLTATSQGVALQHMNQITERIDREATNGAPTTFAPRFARLLPSGEVPLLTFRVGYPVRDARPSPRRSARTVTR